LGVLSKFHSKPATRRKEHQWLQQAIFNLFCDKQCGVAEAISYQVSLLIIEYTRLSPNVDSLLKHQCICEVVLTSGYSTSFCINSHATMKGSAAYLLWWCLLSMSGQFVCHDFTLHQSSTMASEAVTSKLVAGLKLSSKLTFKCEHTRKSRFFHFTTQDSTLGNSSKEMADQCYMVVYHLLAIFSSRHLAAIWATLYIIKQHMLTFVFYIHNPSVATTYRRNAFKNRATCET
jgi:hypothetical protein